MRTKIYIAGPMTGYPDHNLPAFAEAAQQLNRAGYLALNPGRRGVIAGYTWSDYLRMDLVDLLSCHAVAVLDKWEESNGAQLEVHVARTLGMDVRELGAWLEAA